MGPPSSSPQTSAQLAKVLRVQKNLVKNQMIWDAKRNLAKKRLMDLTSEKKEEDGNTDNSADCLKTTKANATVHLDCGFDVSMSAMKRAVEFQKSLSPLLPCCLKLMLGSHVSGGFWLGIPKPFSDQHLPKHDDTIVLVDDDGHEHYTKYLANKNGISGGWRGFALYHKLLAGDVLIFQLIQPCKLKVYIVRERSSTKINESIDLVDLDATEKLTDTKDRPEDKSRVNECCDDDLHDPEPEAGGIRFSKSVLHFNDVKGFKDFTIQVDGLILDSEISTHLRAKYYNLCCSQKKFLHENLIVGLNSQLTAGVISEIVNIADAVGAVNLATSVHHLETWDRTLDAFEDLGMAVGFMRSIIQKLVSLSKESRAVIELKTKERNKAVLEMQALRRKLIDAEALVKSLNAEIHGFQLKYEEHVSGLSDSVVKKSSA